MPIDSKKERSFKRELLDQMLALATSGLGLVAALAWNELIKEVIEVYIKPVTGVASGFISLLIYAVIVTILAVEVTYYLTKLTRRP